MKKLTTTVIILTLVFLILIGLVIYAIFTTKPTQLRQKDFEENIEVLNFGFPSFYDTIVERGLYELGIDSATVVLAKNKTDDDKGFRAHAHYQKGIYYIFLNKEHKKGAVEVIAHELIHLKQYKDSVVVYYPETNTFLYKGEVQDLSDMSDYPNRPWEKEAFIKGPKLEKKILIEKGS